MNSSRVITCVRRTDVDAQDEDDRDDFVLVSVQATGPHPLDLKLIGTQGEHVYATSIRHNKIKDLQLRPAYKGSDVEWEEILTRVLMKTDEPSQGATDLDGIEIVSAVSGDGIILSLRKNIAGVTQRIGAIRLQEDDDQEISLFHWTASAAMREDAARKEKRAAQAMIVTKDNECRRYKEQCENMAQVKSNHETAVMAKTVQILNAKKLKIRDLQRLLACAKVDPVAAAAVEGGARKSTRGRSAGPSRPNKRAANTNSDSESDQDSSFESRKPEPADDEDDDETDGADVTPDNSDQDETEDEQDGDMGHVTSVPGAAKPGEGAKKNAIETVAGNGDSPEQRKPDSPPPRRELPFTRKSGHGLSGQQRQSGKASAADEDEDDTTDDEL